MSYELKIVNPVEYPDWDSLVLTHSDYSFFHSSAWARVLNEAYGYRPMYFTIFKGDRLHALLPVMEVKSILTGKRGISLPFSDFCEPILDEEALSGELVEAVIEYGKTQHWKYLEIRGGHFFFDKPVFKIYQEHILALKPDEKKIIEAFRSSTWRNVKKAIKNGVEVKILNSPRALKDFYRLHCYSRKRHGAPPQPFTFFKKIQEYIISRGLGLVVLACHGEKVISGNIFFHFGKKAIYKYGASDKRYQHLRAANLAMWMGIKWYRDHGYTSLSLGRTDLQNEGLQQFKRGWGTSAPLIKYYRYGLSQAAFLPGRVSSRRVSAALFSRTPVWLLKIIGTTLYRHIG
jgi:hypothetical protein